MEYIVYIFQATPGTNFAYYIPVSVFAGLMILMGLFLKFRSKKDKAFRKVFKHTSGTFISTGVTTFILLGTRYQEIPFISMRFILGLTVAFGIYMIFRSSMRYKKEYLELIQQMSQRKTKPKEKTYSHSKKRK